MEDRKRSGDIVECPNCGNEVKIDDETQYCPKCGTKLDFDRTVDPLSEQDEIQESSVELNDESAQSSSRIDLPEDPEFDVKNDAAKGKKSLKRVLIITPILLLVMLGLLFATHVICFHEWTAATCATPETCSICGRTRGDTLPHNWEPATCTTPETCSVCGKTNGSPLDHDYSSWETTSKVTWSKDGEKERKCARCGNIETEVIPAYLKPVATMVKDYDETAKKVFSNYIMLDKETEYNYFSVCGYSNEDYIEISFLNENGGMPIGSTDTTIPAQISFLQVLYRNPGDSYSYDLILDTAGVFLVSACQPGAVTRDIQEKLYDLANQLSARTDYGTQQESTTIYGAKVTLSQIVTRSGVTLSIDIVP